MSDTAARNDFSQGKVWKHILNIAIPMTIAQLVQVLYNMVDRIYIGHLPGASSLALTGLGLAFPVITLISAFTSLFGGGGAPLCSIARGNHDTERAERIMGTTFTMLCLTSVLLMAVGYGFLKPILYLFGASDATYPYARAYLMIYLIGTPFIMMTLRSREKKVACLAWPSATNTAWPVAWKVITKNPEKYSRRAGTPAATRAGSSLKRRMSGPGRSSASSHTTSM